MPRTVPATDRPIRDRYAARPARSEPVRHPCEDRPVTTEDPAPAAGRGPAVARAVRELEQHVASSGWDGPVRLFALVNTAGALARDPGLAGALGPEVVAAATADPEHLTAVEQDRLPATDTLEALLAGIAWPDTVDGAAVVVERVVVPPEAEAQAPRDPEAAVTFLAEHPDRRELRLAAGVLRDGTSACAVRARDHDSDDRVAVGQDLVPGLVAAVSATLEG